ncbi:MAG: pitrilysin family protein [Cytophagales bacterium]|nr:insulinase family protein [Bernardetiaceae bacterium]MDW8204823.1 pitrilysin family protein [Cytophagales bacterium]
MEQTVIDRSVAPPICPIGDFPLVLPQNFTLPNNTVLHLISAGKQPVVNVQLNFNTSGQTGKQRAVALLANKMLAEGTRQHPATSLMAAIDQLGAFIELSAGFDQSEIEFYCLHKHLHTMLVLIREMLAEPDFSEKQLEKLKTVTAQNIRINLEKTATVASNLFRQSIFGAEHPYGSIITEEHITTTSLQEVQQFYQQYYAEKPFEIIAAGQYQPPDVQLFADTLGTLPALAATPAYVSRHVNKPSVIIHQTKENAVQSSIRIGKIIDLQQGKNSKDYLVLNLLVEALGGYFGSRLMQNIREKKGLTYGIYANLVTLQQATYLVIGADVKKQLRELAIEEIQKEIDSLIQQPISHDELERVRSYMQGTFISSINTAFAIANRYKGIYYHQLPEDYYHRYVSSLNQITTEDLLQSAEKYLQTGFSVISVG